LRQHGAVDTCVSVDNGFDSELDKLFAAEREARQLHDALARRGREGELSALLARLNARIAAAETLEAEEAVLVLVCAARLLGEFEGPEVADALIDVLASEQAEARYEAGEQLQALAFDRFKEVAHAVERALERCPEGSLALIELPYVLADIPEPGVVKLLGRFVKHARAEVVAAAIEALAEVGDPAGAKLLEPLREDARTTTLDEDDGGVDVTIGELARDAIDLLSRDEGAEGEAG
jgi:hypothetical protein